MKETYAAEPYAPKPGITGADLANAMLRVPRRPDAPVFFGTPAEVEAKRLRNLEQRVEALQKEVDALKPPPPSLLVRPSQEDLVRFAGPERK